MLIIPPLPRRRKHRPETMQLPFGPPVLVRVTYDPGVLYTMTFDRTMRFEDMYYAHTLIDDPIDTGNSYIGNHINVLGARSVEVSLALYGAATGTGRSLTAMSNNAIYDLAGTEWSGGTFEIPFG